LLTSAAASHPSFGSRAGALAAFHHPYAYANHNDAIHALAA
jgi:hypothetical protein